MHEILFMCSTDKSTCNFDIKHSKHYRYWYISIQYCIHYQYCMLFGHRVKAMYFFISHYLVVAKDEFPLYCKLHMEIIRPLKHTGLYSLHWLHCILYWLAWPLQSFNVFCKLCAILGSEMSHVICQQNGRTSNFLQQIYFV